MTMAVVWVLFVALRFCFASGQATMPGMMAIEKIVEVHNVYRCGMCNTPPLEWDDAIAKNAKDYMATGAPYGHCPQYGDIPGCVGNGENMYSGAAGDDAFEWERAINMWFASEIDCYDFDTGRNTCTAGHMTQVAWDTSTKIGCASNPDATGGMKTLCMYSEPGNYIGEFVKHVHKCPVERNYEYYTGSASCCNGPQTNCKMGMCGWEYAKDTTTKGCPAEPGCTLHASCTARPTGPGGTTTPRYTPTPRYTTTPGYTPGRPSFGSTRPPLVHAGEYLTFRFEVHAPTVDKEEVVKVLKRKVVAAMCALSKSKGEEMHPDCGYQQPGECDGCAYFKGQLSQGVGTLSVTTDQYRCQFFTNRQIPNFDTQEAVRKLESDSRWLTQDISSEPVRAEAHSFCAVQHV